MRYNYVLLEWLKLKKKQLTTPIIKDMKEMKLSHTAGWNIKWHFIFREERGSLEKNLEVS